LNVFQINVPALKERKGDIPLLSHFFVAKRGVQISDTAMLQLQRYDWPGNVRELENVLERAAILSSDGVIEPQHLPADIAGVSQTLAQPEYVETQNNFSIPELTVQLEKKLIMSAIAECSGNKAKAAKLLEISERSLWYKLDQYQLK
jgi:two-component system, NtrC family, response regulator AtoC